MNRMLISTSQQGEVRVALVKKQALYDLDIERQGFEQKKGNIYKSKISRIEPSLEAAFVDYGANKHGFLPFKEIAKSSLQNTKLSEDINIKDVLKEGMELIVQIDKEERGTKGAALTTFISLAGTYLVLMPNNPKVGGISRRITGKERDEIRDNMRSLNIPEGMGAIIRTSGLGKSKEELQTDLNYLLEQWEAINNASKEKISAPFLIYQEGDAVLRAIRDYLRQDIMEIIVDTEDLYEKTKQYIKQVKPDFIKRIKFYNNKTPLFSHYQIEKQIESAYKRIIKLKSGGSIVIDRTEALVSIDVNSAKSTSGGDIEATAFHTNIEAADEIARQLRLRDIGGLVVIDFIDMSSFANQREVSHNLRKSLEHDRARIQVGNITRFGLLEMSRQRLRPHIGAKIQISCPRCDGQGTIRNIESLSTSIINLIAEEASKNKTSQVEAQLPIELATFLLNEQRSAINEIEKTQKVNILIIPNQHLETPKYKIKRIRQGEGSAKINKSSYKRLEKIDMKIPEKKPISKKEPAKPIVTSTLANLGKITKSSKKLFLTKAFKKLFSSKKPKTKNTRNKKYNKKSSIKKNNRKVSPKNLKYYKPGSKTYNKKTTSTKKHSTKSTNRRGNRGGKKRLTPPNTDAYPEITAEKANIGQQFKKPAQKSKKNPTPPLKKDQIKKGPKKDKKK